MTRTPIPSPLRARTLTRSAARMRRRTFNQFVVGTNMLDSSLVPKGQILDRRRDFVRIRVRQSDRLLHVLTGRDLHCGPGNNRTGEPDHRQRHSAYGDGGGSSAPATVTTAAPTGTFTQVCTSTTSGSTQLQSAPRSERYIGHYPLWYSRAAWRRFRPRHRSSFFPPPASRFFRGPTRPPSPRRKFRRWSAPPTASPRPRLGD